MKIKNMIKTNMMRRYRKSLFVMTATLLLALPFPGNGGASLTTSAPATLAAAPASDFTLVITSNHSFGDVSSGGTFQGEDQSYPFTLPSNLGSGRMLVMLTARGVGNNCNRFEVNGTQINGILVNRDNSNEQHTELFDVPPNVLKPGANTLYIRAVNSSCTAGGNLDEFVLNNVVFLYHVQ
jgi:hypothetical protein